MCCKQNKGAVKKQAAGTEKTRIKASCEKQMCRLSNCVSEEIFLFCKHGSVIRIPHFLVAIPLSRLMQSLLHQVL